MRRTRRSSVPVATASCSLVRLLSDGERSLGHHLSEVKGTLNGGRYGEPTAAGIRTFAAGQSGVAFLPSVPRTWSQPAGFRRSCHDVALDAVTACCALADLGSLGALAGSPIPVASRFQANARGARDADGIDEVPEDPHHPGQVSGHRLPRARSRAEDRRRLPQDDQGDGPDRRWRDLQHGRRIRPSSTAT